MIFASTGTHPNSTAYVQSLEYYKFGIKNIELSGGVFDENLLSQLSQLTKDIQFQCHNYFPPPKMPFVFNLASPNQTIASMSIKHAFTAIDTAKNLGASLYSFHSGFLFDPEINELGEILFSRNLFDHEDSILRFIDRVNQIDEYANSQGVKLLIENNVLSIENLKKFQSNPLLMSNNVDSFQIMNNTSENVTLLMDVAHLIVSSNSLRYSAIDFLNESDSWISAYHLSDNNGLADTNNPITKDSWFWPYLKKNVDYFSLEIKGISTPELLDQIKLTKKKLSE